MPRALRCISWASSCHIQTSPRHRTAGHCGGNRLPRPVSAPSSSKDRTTWQQVAGSPSRQLDGLVRSCVSVLGLATCDVKMWDAVVNGFWSAEGLKKKKKKMNRTKAWQMLTCNMYFYYTFLKNRVMVKLLKTLTFFLNRSPYLTVLAFIKFCSLVPGSFI